MAPFRFAALVSLLSLLDLKPAAAADVDPTYAALRSLRPQGKAISIEPFRIERDALRFQFESGTFQLLAPVQGRTVGAVFLGRGSFELRPASEIERRHLQFVTGDKTLEILAEPFESLVLLFTDGTSAEIEGHGTPAVQAPPGSAELYDTFLRRQRKELRANLQIRLLEDLLSSRGADRGVFLAYVAGRKYPAALAAYDPAGLDWLFGDLGGETTAFSPIGESDASLWYCSAPRERPQAGPSAPLAAHALQYAVETTIRKNGEIAGTTTIRFVPLAADLRVLRIQLLGRLRLKEVSFSTRDPAAWTPAAFVQENEKEDADAAVIFPAALPRTGASQLRLVYEGRDVLRDAGDGNYIVGARESWYPNLGSFADLASYELTYRFPKDLQIVSVGQLSGERLEGDQKIAVWKQDRPVRVAGFNYGKFRKLERKDPESGVTVGVYAATGTPDFIHELNALLARRSGAGPVDAGLAGEIGGISASDIGIAVTSSRATAGLSGVHVDVDSLADSAIADGINTARVGIPYFGPLPEGHVSITQQTQPFFGQSWPSLIYLPYIAALDGTTRRELGLKNAADFIERVGPHEFAHQWWGHLVGWKGYRDQWLSEGFAEYTASLVLQATGGPRKFNDYWEKARRRILEKPPGSAISNDSAGPIALGWRLATRKSPQAYDAMVYSKGAYVLHMLRMMMREPANPRPDTKFIETLKDFAATYAGGNPSTRDFQAVVERHMTPAMSASQDGPAMSASQDGKMDWFFRQWVEGTEIPRYRHKLGITKVGGEQYRINGTVTQEGVSGDFHAVTHIYVETGKGEVSHLGVLPMTGSATVPLDATVRLQREPKRALLNAFHDVLSRD